MSIHVGYIESSPLSVDTEKDLIEIKKLWKIMSKKKLLYKVNLEPILT